MGLKSKILAVITFVILSITVFLIYKRFASAEDKSFLGKYENTQTYTAWMETSPQTFKSYLKISQKSSSLYMNIFISGHHVCELEGFVDRMGRGLKFSTNSKKNRNIDISNASPDNPCELILAFDKNEVEILKESVGCRSDCGIGGSGFEGWKFVKEDRGQALH